MSTDDKDAPDEGQLPALSDSGLPTHKEAEVFKSEAVRALAPLVPIAKAAVEVWRADSAARAENDKSRIEKSVDLANIKDLEKKRSHIRSQTVTIGLLLLGASLMFIGLKNVEVMQFLLTTIAAAFGGGGVAKVLQDRKRSK